MSNDVVAQQSEQEKGDSCADAFVALAAVCLLVTTVVFWVSNQ
ncbi:MAG: hypothetical protein QNK32_05780 [Porticoccus sp.]|nr:hypothetical protein [Porticoccus sp.]